MEPTTVPSGPPEGTRAADVFTAQLLPRPGGVLVHRLRMAGAFVVGLMSGVIPAPSVHDVVVSRRSDGAEVLRIPAGDPADAGDMLRAVTAELETTTEAEFVRGWAER